MMRTHTLTTLILLLSITYVSSAQTPGYMGKRFSIKAELLTTPTFYNANEINNYPEYAEIASFGGFGFSFTPSVGVEYVLGKSVSAGVSLRSSSLNLPMSYYETINDYDNNGDFYYHYGYFGETKIKSKMTSLYFKFYRYKKRGSIAPIGRFHQIEYIFGKSRFEEGDVVITDNQDSNLPFFSTEENQYFLYEEFDDLDFEPVVPFQMVKYAYGFETVMYDKIPVELSLQFAASITEYVNELTGFDAYPSTDAEYEFRGDIHDRLNRSLNLTFNIGIGYFVF